MEVWKTMLIMRLSEEEVVVEWSMFMSMPFISERSRRGMRLDTEGILEL